jgi:cell wall-associated NlpC family hydrolase
MIKRLVLLALVVFAGCGSHPRYRTGGEEHPQQRVKQDAAYDTNDYLRFGSILQEYLGKPYAGKSKYEDGIDCSHFVQAVFKRFDNIKLPRMASDQYQEGREVQFKHLEYGDLVFFKTGRKKISHVGIYVGDNRFIHVSSSQGVIISGLNEKYWAERYVGARRILR